MVGAQRAKGICCPLCALGLSVGRVAPAVEHHRDKTMEQDEQRQEEFALGNFFPDPEDQRIFVVVANYLLLSQFDTARSVIDGYFKIAPERIIRLLRTLFEQRIPDYATWYAARVSVVSYRNSWCSPFLFTLLYHRLLSNYSPSIASIAWFCAVEYERLWSFVSKEVASNPKHPLREKMTTINYFGFIDYDLLVVDGVSS